MKYLTKPLSIIVFLSTISANANTVIEQPVIDSISNVAPNYYAAQTDAISGVDISFTNQNSGLLGRVITYPYPANAASTIHCSDIIIEFKEKQGDRYREGSVFGSLQAMDDKPSANGQCIYANYTSINIHLTADKTYAILFTSQYASTLQWFFRGSINDDFGGPDSKAGFLRYGNDGWYYYESAGINLADYGFKICSGNSCAFSLKFPLTGYTPNNVPISSVLDHSLKYGPYHNDGVIDSSKGKADCANGIEEYSVSSQSGEPVDETKVGKLCDKLKSGKKLKVKNILYDYKINKDDVAYISYDGHTGYDFAVPRDTAIIAPADGILCLATSVTTKMDIKKNIQNKEWRDASVCPYGDDPINGTHGQTDPWSGFHTFYIVHNTPENYSTWYLHSDQLDTVVAAAIANHGYAKISNINGDLKMGDVIAYVGNTGISSNPDIGNHLHFEVRKGLNMSIDASSILMDPYGWNDQPYLWDQ